MQFLKNRVVQVVLGLVVVAIVVVGAIFAFGPKQTTTEVAATPEVTAPAPTTESTEPTPSATTPSAGPTSPAAPAGAKSPATESCTNTDEDITDPKKLTVERIGVDSPMITVGKDEAGNPGAPPKNASNTTAWYNGSPEVGSARGNVILTIHTYQTGNALGNQLYDGGNKALKEGDVIKISDGEGKQVCYRYTNNLKVWEKTYDPASGVFFNPTGPAQLAIMICWDFNKERQNWDSRIIFYAPKMPKAA